MNLDSVSDLANSTARDQIDHLLSSLGLEKRRGAGDFFMPAVGIFAAGVIVGGVLGMLFAPKSGRGLREDVSEKLDQVRRWAGDGDSSKPIPTTDQ